MKLVALASLLHPPVFPQEFDSPPQRASGVALSARTKARWKFGEEEKGRKEWGGGGSTQACRLLKRDKEGRRRRGATVGTLKSDGKGRKEEGRRDPTHL